MSKIGLNALTSILQKNIEKESGKTGIIINAMCPGYCKTEMTKNTGFLTAEQGNYNNSYYFKFKFL